MRKEGICTVCGKKFIYDTYVRTGKFCSNACRYKVHSEIIKESYTPELKELRRQKALKQMQDPKQIEIRRQKLKGRIMTEEHKQNLKGSHPAMDCNTYRKRALEYYGHTCARCGKEFPEDKLIVHHIDENNGGTDVGNHSLENLMVLCRGCHSKLHAELRKTKLQGSVNQVDFLRLLQEVLLTE